MQQPAAGTRMQRSLVDAVRPTISTLAPSARPCVRCSGSTTQRQRRMVAAAAVAAAAAPCAGARRPQLQQAADGGAAGAGAEAGLAAAGVSAAAAAYRPPPHHHHRRRRRGDALVAPAGPAGGMAAGGGHGGRGEPVDTPAKRLALGAAVAYIALVVIVPFVNVFLQAFAKGLGPFLEAVVEHDFLHAAQLTLMLAALTVPLNTLFGVVAAVLITRNEFPGKVLLLSLLDLPFSISPVVTGLMLMLLYGRAGWFASALADSGLTIVFAFPGMLLATMFVTLPFIVRELIPTLEQMDPAQEEAARTLGANPLQVFFRVTLPNIRWGLLYGVILTNARAMGEFGAVSVISGNIIGRTQTLTLYVESAYKEYNSEAAFAAAVLLSALALGTLWVKDKVEQAAAAEAAK